MKNKLWFKIFIRISVIFIIFVIVLTVSNSLFLFNFFVARQKSNLILQMDKLSKIDISDSTGTTELLRNLCDNNNIDIELYTPTGSILYTTFDSQIMDYYYHGSANMSMSHRPLNVTESSNTKGAMIQTAIDPLNGTEYLCCIKEFYGYNAEIRIQKSLLHSSADTANQFIAFISTICFIGAVIWVLIFAKKFSLPISQMNEITKDLSRLDFHRRLQHGSHDEIGQLADSINNMSDRLESALGELQSSNAQLRNEIELERELDSMRKGFVANVSHELKTPISIIRGYAEGLKLSINESARENYCDTIINESERMNKLVLSLLSLSKYESGQISLNKNSFDVSQMAEDMTRSIFNDTNVNLCFDFDPATFVYADDVLTEQVLKSYLENAHSHIDKDGTLTVSCHRINGKVKIGICNTGSHVEPEQMPLIWQSFYRGEQSHKRESSRFGLGLSIVSAICRLHNTECGVYNTDNGVCFWFTLDIPDEQKAE